MTTSAPTVVWTVVTVVLVLARLLGPLVFDDPFEHAPWVMGVWLLEPLLVIAIAWWGLRRLPLARMFSQVQRIVVGALVGALALVQFAPVELDAYPFTWWAMYTVSAETAVYTEFRMLSSGEPVGDLPIADLVPNTLGRAFMFRLSDWAEQAEAGDPQAVDVLGRTLRELLDRHGAPHVDAVEVRWCRVGAPRPDAPATCETAVTVAR